MLVRGKISLMGSHRSSQDAEFFEFGEAHGLMDFKCTQRRTGTPLPFAYTSDQTCRQAAPGCNAMQLMLKYPWANDGR